MDTDTIRIIEEQEIALRPRKLRARTQIVYRVPKTIYNGRIKRLVDVLVSSVLILALLSWITPILFLLIRLGSKGPLFFVQKRTGLLGKSFSCFKFRTMLLNSESEITQADTFDKRITGIGHFLRITHIDELPQLVNVLIGDMSLVGPRPHMIFHDLMFSALLPQYQMRHLVKPGITGLAQSAGYHGTTTDFFSISNRTRLDLFYVNRMSPGLDLKIILTTLFVMPIKHIKHFNDDGNNGR